MCSSTNICCLNIDDFNQVVITCSRVSSHWEELAPYLNIDRPTVEGIQKEGSRQTTGWCLNRLITSWLRQPSPTQPKPSWRILCDAVSNIDRPLSEKIWTDHTSGCNLCRVVCDEVNHETRQLHVAERNQLWPAGVLIRQTAVAMAVQQGNATEAAKELESDFDDLVEFLIIEISKINVDVLRYRISQYFEKEEGTIDEEMEKHLTKIEDYDKPSAVLNYFRRHRFIGYVNYSLIKVFQGIAKSPLLDKRIEEYEKDYQCFLELSLSHIHDAFQQCPDLRPDYPAGIPKFTIHLKSKWDGKTMFKLKEFLKQCFNDSCCVDQLMIAKISRNCIIITYAVLPHIARKVLGYLTNDDVIVSMKKEGISIDVSKQLMEYEEELETTDSIASMEQTHETLQGLETDPSHSSHTIKQDWDTAVTDITSGYSEDSETNEYSRLVELKDDVTLKEAVDTYESVVTMLRKRIKSLENQLVTHKQMMMELDSTRESLKQVTLEHDNTRDELKKTKQSMSVLKAELISLKRLIPSDPDLLDENLLEAAEKGDIELIETLIKFGANVNTTHKSSRHNTPLHLASYKGHCDAVNVLISLGAKVNKKNDQGDTPLHDASWNGHSDTVNTLISHGATIDEKNNMDYTPLHQASSEGHSDTVNTLIYHGATINEKNSRGRTPLHEASSYGHSDTVNTLISHGATINEKSDIMADTPLHRASVNSHSDTVKVLLSNGAIVNSLDEFHETPLHKCLALSRNHNITDTVELLISHGADLYQEDKYGNSPILIATLFGHEDLLLSHGVSEDTISKYRLPETERWKARRFYDGRIQYTNTMTGVERLVHPLPVVDGSTH